MKGEIMNKRAYRRTRIKRSRKIRKLRFYALVAILIGVSVFSFKSIAKNKSDNQVSGIEKFSKEEIKDAEYVLAPKPKNKDIGEIESIIEYGNNCLIGVHYPVFGKDNIDKINKKMVTEYIEDFKNQLKEKGLSDKDYKNELSIDYEVQKAPNNMVSINFNIIKNASYLAHPDESLITRTYDISNDKELKLDEIMDGQYLKFISGTSENYFREDEKYKDGLDSELFKEGIHPSKENYSNFILKKDRIIIIFDKYELFSGNLGASYVEIPYVDLRDYIKPNLLEGFIKEENKDKKDEENSKAKVDLLIPKRTIDPNKPMIALTFDDGPNKKVTIPILDVLKEYDSAATFFILGNRVSSNEDVLKRMLEEGSEIGNHSYNHKQLTKISAEELNQQMANTQNAVIKATGIEPKLMRPTYGSYDDNLKAKVKMPFILWSVDTLDWKSRDSRKVTDHVLSHVKDGDIILMHDIYDSTAEAVKILVPKLTEMGYQLVTVSELYESRGETFKDGEIYNQIHKK